MLSLLLVRTGSTEYASQGRVQGTLDVPLSEDGRLQIEQVAEQLADHEIEALVAGPCGATQQSANLLAERLHLKVKTLDGLANLDHGLWQGMLIDDVKTKQPKVYRQWQEHPETVCPPDGETLATAFDRLHQAVAKIVKKYKSGTVAVVIAEPLASLLRNTLRDDALGNLWQVEDENLPQWEILEIPTEVASR